MAVIRALRRHSLSLTLVLVLTIMLGITIYLGTYEYKAEMQTTTLDGFWTWWFFETTLSLEADVFGAFILVTFTKFLFEKGSSEAEDPPEEKERSE